MAYSIIMLLVGVLFTVISILIYKGHTNLIHDYHQTDVTDKQGYGRAFGKALSIMAVAFLISAVLGLFSGELFVWLSLGVTVLGIIISIIFIVIVQKKYNGKFM